ncbi:MAG TPA: hypothetical protein DDE71_09640 [Tenacibaculum sp.]|nr:hypothetical protein [Tenacibaculum sp.]
MIGEKKDGINWCYLKSKANNRKSKSNSTSGRTSCSCGGHKKCFDPDTDYIANGADIGWIRVNSEKDCSCECDKDDRCRIWTWVKGKVEKWLWFVIYDFFC